MNNQDNTKRYLIYALLLWGLAYTVFVALPVSEEDVQACVKSTGWSQDRCRVELSK